MNAPSHTGTSVASLWKGLGRVTKLLSVHQRRHAWLLLVATLLLVGSEVLGVASLFPLMSVATSLQLPQEGWLTAWSRGCGATDAKSFLYFTSAIFLTCFALVAGGNLALVWLRFRFCYDLCTDWSVRLLSNSVRRPFEWFLCRHTSDVANLIVGECENSVRHVVLMYLELICELLLTLALALYLFFFDPLVAAATSLMILTLYGAIYHFSRERFVELGQRRAAEQEISLRTVGEALALVKEARLPHRTPLFLERYQQSSRRQYHALVQAEVYREMPRWATEFLAVASIVVVLLYLIRQGDAAAAVARLTVYAMATWRLVPSVQKILGMALRIQFYWATFEQVEQQLIDNFAEPGEDFRAGHLPSDDANAEAKPSADTDLGVDSKPALSPGFNPGRIATPPKFEQLRLLRVSYRYPKSEADAIQELTLSLPANRITALVGPTGAGKTTVADLLAGVLTPTGGEILLNGQAPLHWWRWVGYVPQDPYLVDDSLAANIALGCQTIDQERVYQVCHLAGLESVLADWPAGIQTRLGERGANLSGGQRQRIGLARALYGKPQLLVLDESTNALDPVTETVVWERLRQLDITIVVIAHRMRTVQECDWIYFIRAGRLVAEGRYSELLADCSSFAEFSGAELSRSNGEG